MGDIEHDVWSRTTIAEVEWWRQRLAQVRAEYAEQAGRREDRIGVLEAEVAQLRGAEDLLRELVDALDDISSPESEKRLDSAVVAARALVHPGRR